MALRGKKPEVAEKRLKLFLYGPAGVGKTTAAIQMPNPYIIDTEKGTEQREYVDKINRAGGAVFRTQSLEEIVEEVKSLISEDHPYKTLVLDAVTNIEDGIVNDARNELVKKNKAKDKDEDSGSIQIWGKRNTEMTRLRSLLLKVDMNVVVIAHGKDIRDENFKKTGTTFEGWKKWPFIFDLVLKLDKMGKKRMAYVEKTRMADEFPDEDQFEWSYQELSKRYNPAAMEKDSTAVRFATTEQVDQMRDLMNLVTVEPGWEARVFKKADVECWEDMPSELIQKCIDAQIERLHSVNKERVSNGV